RPGGALFGRSVAAFAKELRDAKKSRERGLVERQPGELLPFERRESRDVVVETGHGDSSPRITKLAKQLAQRHRRIIDCASVNAGVQIARRSAQFDFHGGDS